MCKCKKNIPKSPINATITAVSDTNPVTIKSNDELVQKITDKLKEEKK